MKDDANYLQAGIDLVRSVSLMLALDDERPSLAASRILDIGCGSGRLLSGLQARAVPFETYVGVDVQEQVVNWAEANLGSEAVRFHFVDLRNARYNPEGVCPDRLELPEQAHSFDLIVLRSVFTHMLAEDMRFYARELQRFLAPRGRLYVSVFAEMGVVEEEENPADYKVTHTSGPLHVVRVNRHSFETMMCAAGWDEAVFCRSIMDQPTYLFRSVLAA